MQTMYSASGCRQCPSTVQAQQLSDLVFSKGPDKEIRPKLQLHLLLLWASVNQLLVAARARNHGTTQPGTKEKCEAIG